MDRAARGRELGGARGALTSAASTSQCAWRGDGRGGAGAQGEVAGLGSAEVTAQAEAASWRRKMSSREHRKRGAQKARIGENAAETKSSCERRDERAWADWKSQPSVVHRLQGLVANPRWKAMRTVD